MILQPENLPDDRGFGVEPARPSSAPDRVDRSAGEVVPVRDECGVGMLKPIRVRERVVIRRRNARTVGGTYPGVQAGILAACRLPEVSEANRERRGESMDDRASVVRRPIVDDERLPALVIRQPTHRARASRPGMPPCRA